MMYGPGFLRMLFCGLPFLLLLAVLIGLLVWALTVWSRSSGQRTAAGGDLPAATPGGTDRALDILRERYARGEITKEQYEEMRRDLTV